MSDKKSSGGGIGICTVLLVVFIVLKLTGLVAWSWLWVLAPLWIPITIVLVLCAIIGIAYVFK